MKTILFWLAILIIVITQTGSQFEYHIFLNQIKFISLLFGGFLLTGLVFYLHKDFTRRIYK